jgi:hypothetical protein
MTDEQKALALACECAGRKLHHYALMGDDLPLKWSIVAHADTIMHYEALQAERDAQAAEIERLREEPTLTITRAQYDEFVESAEDHTILWTDTLALIGVYVAPCQTKIDVQDSRPNKGNDSAAQ